MPFASHLAILSQTSALSGFFGSGVEVDVGIGVEVGSGIFVGVGDGDRVGVGAGVDVGVGVVRGRGLAIFLDVLPKTSVDKKGPRIKRIITQRVKNITSIILSLRRISKISVRTQVLYSNIF